eukprot:TRINITY_DN804_c0_g1_i6.p1 TRINITY_DN804_c0_g1~~TRINITY_DN804_c0_g1_i6.p1  ORF type:complete len:141 (+),score=16.26 TRINITY_DN804_c0_g1_i6:638-1060(+)
MIPCKFWDCLSICFRILKKNEEMLACHYEMLLYKEKIVKDNPTSWNDWEKLGDECSKYKYHGPALDAYAKAIKLIETQSLIHRNDKIYQTAKLYYKRGNAYSCLSKNVEATAACDTAIEMLKGVVPAHFLKDESSNKPFF